MLVEDLSAVPGAEERPLDQILGYCLVAHDAQNNRVNQAPVAIIKLRQGTTVPPRHPPQNISAITSDFYRHSRHLRRRRTVSSASSVVYEQSRVDGWQPTWPSRANRVHYGTILDADPCIAPERRLSGRKQRFAKPIQFSRQVQENRP